MPLFDYTCEHGHTTEHIVHHHEETPKEIECKACRDAGHTSAAKKIPNVWGRYKGCEFNSASTTPKRWKGF